MATLDLTKRSEVPIRATITGDELFATTVGSLLYVTSVQSIIAAAAAGVDWNSIPNKPTTYPPSSHTHIISNVLGLQDALNDKASTGSLSTVAFSGDYDDLLNKPVIPDVSGFVEYTRLVGAGSGLSGGGDLSADRTISLSSPTIASLSLADTAVQPGELGDLATKDKVNNSDWSGAALAVANGGTGATGAATARANLGLGNVDNTSDTDKPVSTAQQAALNLKESRNSLFRRRKVVELPLYSPTAPSIISSHSYDGLFPQAVHVDVENDQVFIVSNRVNVGDDSYAWITVWDISDILNPVALTMFTPGLAGSYEGIAYRKIGSNRYLYLSLIGVGVVEIDITTLPADGSTVVPTNTYNPSRGNYPYPMWDGDRWHMPDPSSPGGMRFIATYDEDWNYLGTTELPQEATGQGFYLNYFPKSQGITWHNGRFYTGCGGGYAYDNPSSDPLMGMSLQGVVECSANGSSANFALVNPERARSAFSELCGYPVQRIENEGICSSYGRLFAMWVTTTFVTPDPLVGGIIIAEEMSSSPDAVDFSFAAASLPHTFNKALASTSIRTSSSQLTNLGTGGALNSFGDIIDMMVSLGMNHYTFYGNNQTLTDINGTPVDTTGYVYEFRRAGSFACVIEAWGNGNLYSSWWVSPISGGSRIQYLLQMTGEWHRGLRTSNHALNKVDGVGITSGGTITAYNPSSVVGWLGRGNNGGVINFSHNGVGVGSISITESATAYNTSSDITLKNDLGELSFEDAKAIVELVTIHNFSWKSTGQEDVGAFAQELYEVYPRAVSRGGWFMPDDDTNEVQEGEEGAVYRPWFVDYSKLVPVIMRVLKEVLLRDI